MWLMICAAGSAASYVWIDRRVADYVHYNLLQRNALQGLASWLDVLLIFVVLAIAMLFGCGGWKLAGRELQPWTGVPLQCSWALMWGLSTAEVLKRALGRADTEMWTGEYAGGPHLGVYGFHLLHGVQGYQSFPSGTTAATASALGVLWILAPRQRWIWIVILAFVAGALIITNGHFVSDVIAGGFLGATVGWMTVLLMKREDSNGEAGAE
jgi:membrane-associated phospholipid phosphatase